MSRQVEAFRHPAAEELLELMEKARVERSMFLARMLGLRAAARDPKPVEEGTAAAVKPSTIAAMAA